MHRITRKCNVGARVEKQIHIKEDEDEIVAKRFDHSCILFRGVRRILLCVAPTLDIVII